MVPHFFIFAMSSQNTRLARKLNTTDAVVIGLGAMIGSGIFVAISPAVSSAGAGILIGLSIAAVIAYCNATSSAQLAAVYPPIRRNICLWS